MSTAHGRRLPLQRGAYVRVGRVALLLREVPRGLPCRRRRVHVQAGSSEQAGDARVAALRGEVQRRAAVEGRGAPCGEVRPGQQRGANGRVALRRGQVKSGPTVVDSRIHFREVGPS